MAKRGVFDNSSMYAGSAQFGNRCLGTSTQIWQILLKTKLAGSSQLCSFHFGRFLSNIYRSSPGELVNIREE